MICIGCSSKNSINKLHHKIQSFLHHLYGRPTQGRTPKYRINVHVRSVFSLKLTDKNSPFFSRAVKIISIDNLIQGFYFIQGLIFQENQ